jgi:siroheme synthase-like protein
VSAAPFPLFLRLEGRRVLLVGGGPVAREKGLALVEAGARVRVVAPLAEAELVAAAADVEFRAFSPTDLDDAWLVVAAAPPAVNRSVKAAADARRVFCLAVDDVESCSAIGAARLRRGAISVAISTGGAAPALVALLRRAIDALLPDDVGAWESVATGARAAWKKEGLPIAERRPRLLQALNALYAEDARLP